MSDWTDADITKANSEGWTIRLKEPAIFKMFQGNTVRSWITSLTGRFDGTPHIERRAAEGNIFCQRGLAEAARRHAVWRLTQ